MVTICPTIEVAGTSLDVPSAPTVAHFLLDSVAISDNARLVFYNDLVSLTRLHVSEKAVQLARNWRQTGWVKPGEVVIILSPSKPEFIIAVLALHLIGCTVSPCNPLVKPEEFASQLKLSRASKVITTPATIDVARASLKQTGVEEVHQKIAIFTGSIDGIITIESLTADSTGAAFDPDEWNASEWPAFICWSSGTSGPPKALALSHHNIISNIIQFDVLLGDRFNNYHQGRTDEVHIDVLPQFHAYGLITTLLAYHTCTPRYVMERFDVNLFAEIAEREQATFSMLVPPALLRLAKTPSITPKSLASIRSIASGAASLPQDIRERLKKKFNIIVTDGYGCTECSPIISAQAPRDVIAGRLGVGPLAPGMHMRIVDLETEKDLGRNQAGEIRVKGPNVFSGYIDKEATKTTFDGFGFYKTGDIGVVDDDGHLCITDRAKDLIKYNGFQVSASEIEAILISHPAISDAAVIGVYDEAYATELPKAFVVAVESTKPSDELTQNVLGYTSDRVANYKKLRGGLEWIEAIPKNASGKILRRQLREIARASHIETLQEQLPLLLEKKPSLPTHLGSTLLSEAVAGGAVAFDLGGSRKTKGKKLDGFSNMMLMMDENSYHAACFSIYTFVEDVSLEIIHAFFHELVAAFPKYGQVLVDRHRTFGPASWKDHREVEASRDWRLEDNIREITLPERANGRNALFAEAGSFLAAKFDYKRPVWEALLVHNVNRTEYNGCASLMIKIHHCFSDGQGMIQSYHSALHALNHDVSVGTVQRDADAKLAQAKYKANTKKLSWGKVVASTHNHAWHSIRGLFIAGRRQTFAYTESRGQTRAEGRIYAHSKGTALSDLAVVRKAFSTDKYKVTLNDVACAIATLAFRREASKRSSLQAMPEGSIAMLIPISLRPDYDWDLENYSSGAIAWFGWGKKQEKDFQSVIIQVHKEMKMIKRSKFPAWGLSIFKHVMKYPINYQPRWPVLRHLYNKAFEQYHILTNVPGPSTPVSFGGVEASSYHVLPPSSPGKASMAIGLVSYAGQFSIAISCDRVSELRSLPIDLCASFENVAAEVVKDAKRRLANAPTPILP